MTCSAFIHPNLFDQFEHLRSLLILTLTESADMKIFVVFALFIIALVEVKFVKVFD